MRRKYIVACVMAVMLMALTACSCGMNDGTNNSGTNNNGTNNNGTTDKKPDGGVMEDITNGMMNGAEDIGNGIENGVEDLTNGNNNSNNKPDTGTKPNP